MSTPRLRRNRGSTDSHARSVAFALMLGALLACATAQATQADRDKPVNVNANSFSGSQDSGKATFIGNVRIDQGTLHADGDHGVGYFDQNNQVQRVVLTGTPAHMQQKLDDGAMMHGSADTIDYTVSQNTVVLTGDANVVQEGRGSFHGAKLVYNTDSGQINGEGGSGGQVHMTLQPRPKNSPAAKPAPATTAGAAPAPASSSTQPAPAASAPAPASSTHG
jgi:lipopolysaccharide export system protein LptA